MIRAAGVLLVARRASRCPAPPAARASRLRSAGLTLTPFAGGFDSPRLRRTRPRSEPGKLYVVEQPGVIRVLVNGKLRAQPFLDIRSLVHERRRAGTALDRVPPALREEPPLLRRLHRPQRRHPRRRVPLERDGRRCRRPRGGCCSSTSRSPTTTAASSSSGPTGCCTSAWATAARAATRGNRAQNLNIRLGQAAAPQRGQGAARRWQVTGYGLRNPWRFSFDRRRATSTSATSARATGRRSTCARPAQQRALSNYGWRVWEGRSRYTAGQQVEPARRARLPDRRLQPHDAAARSPAATSTAAKAVPAAARPLLLRRLLQRHDLEPARVAREADLRAPAREPFRVSNLSSFGEDAAGELYATSLDGTVYRLSR